MAGTLLVGERLVVLEFYQGIVEVWDLRTKECLRKFPVVHEKNPARQAIGVVSAAQVVVQVSYDGSLFVVDLDAGERVFRLQSSERLNEGQSVIYGGEVRCLSGVGGSTMCGYLRTWNLDTGELVAGLDLQEVHVKAAFAPEAGLAAVVSSHANLHLYKLDTWQEVARWRIAPERRSVVTDTEDGDGYELTAVGISPDGKSIAVGEASGRVHLLRYDRGGLRVLR
jgi:WD40 repeat protein